jgi:hypothetical protein
MTKKGNAAAENNNITTLKFTSAADLLHDWNNSLSEILLYGQTTNETASALNSVVAMVKQNSLFENLQRLILDEMLSRTAARDKEQFIRMVQLMVTRLLDGLSGVTEKNPSLPETEPVLIFIQVLLKLIHFIQEFFGSYFDKNEKIPAILLNSYKNEIGRLGEKFSDIINHLPHINSWLGSLLINHFTEAAWMNRKQNNYRHFYFEKELLTQLLHENNPTDKSLREQLYYFNFNCSSFVIYEFDRLAELVTRLPAKSEKINMLRAELKKINQLPIRMNCCYDEDMPSLKEQVSNWIEEEIKYCEAGHFLQPLNSNSQDTENKIHTTLSVAKLGLLVRLLVVDKIIINRSVAPMLRTVAKTFTTLQREEISFGSLETKYHAPDKATILVMKEMLQNG